MNHSRGSHSRRKAVIIEIVIVTVAIILLVFSVDALPSRAVSFSRDVMADQSDRGIYFDMLPSQTVTGTVIDRGSVNNESAIASSPWLTFYYPNNNIPINPNPVIYNYAEHQADFSFTASTAGTYYAVIDTDPHFPDRIIDCSYSVTLLGIDPLLIVIITIGVTAILTLVNISMRR